MAEPALREQKLQLSSRSLRQEAPGADQSGGEAVGGRTELLRRAPCRVSDGGTLQPKPRYCIRSGHARANGTVYRSAECSQSV